MSFQIELVSSIANQRSLARIQAVGLRGRQQLFAGTVSWPARFLSLQTSEPLAVQWGACTPHEQPSTHLAALLLVRQVKCQQRQLCTQQPECACACGRACAGQDAQPNTPSSLHPALQHRSMRTPGDALPCLASPNPTAVPRRKQGTERIVVQPAACLTRQLAGGHQLCQRVVLQHSVQRDLHQVKNSNTLGQICAQTKAAWG